MIDPNFVLNIFSIITRSFGCKHSLNCLPASCLFCLLKVYPHIECISKCTISKCSTSIDFKSREYFVAFKQLGWMSQFQETLYQLFCRSLRNFLYFVETGLKRTLKSFRIHRQFTQFKKAIATITKALVLHISFLKVSSPQLSFEALPSYFPPLITHNYSDRSL